MSISTEKPAGTAAGHFAAWEEPMLFASEIRAAFSPLRAPRIPERRR